MGNSYVYRIFQEGTCPSLVNGTVFFAGENAIIQPDPSGLVSLEMAVSAMRPGGTSDMQSGLFAGTAKLLGLMEKTAEGFMTAWDHMVFPHMISFDCREIYFDEVTKNVRLTPKSRISPGLMSISDENDVLITGFSDVLYQLEGVNPYAGAGDMAGRIIRAQRRGSLDASRLLRLISAWRLELL